MKLPLMLVPVLVLGAAAVYAGGGGDSEVGWGKNLATALKQAKREHKLVLVDFNATWCPPCKQYKSAIFPTSQFKNATKGYILVNIDADEQQQLAMKYGVSGIPDIRVLNPKGKQLGQVVGFDPDDLYKLLAKSRGAR